MACILFLGATWKADRHVWGVLAMVGLVLAGVAASLIPRPAATEPALFAGPLWLDNLAVLTRIIALAGGAVLVLLTWNEPPERHAGEFHGCMLVIVAGVSFTGLANDLVVLFVGLEMISIPTYVLLYLPRSDDQAREAGVKYFLLSVFSSALLLFGFSYLYGLAGTTNLHGIADALTNRPAEEAAPVLVLMALGMVVAGLGFKITAFPFHAYAPDVYQGTTHGAAALLAFIPKVAGFVAFVRVLNLLPFTYGKVTVLPIAFSQTSTMLYILAVSTMTVGNLLALWQDDLKRLLAYSSVAHAGYMLIGLTVAPYLREAPLGVGGVAAVMFYLVAYGAMTVGVFAVLSYLNSPARPVQSVDDLAGLGKSHPRVALVMMLFLLSLIGIPLTAGFVGKLLLFLGAFAVPFNPGKAFDLEQARLFRVLALIAAVNAAVAGWYYLRIITMMYLKSPGRPLPQPKPSPVLGAIWICALVTLVFGIYADPLKARVQAVETPTTTAGSVPAQALVGQP
jgi:NADH-quinone oxidoreductase subunit N